MSFTKFTTGKGIAVFPSLTKADTRFNAEGVFKTGLNITDPVEVSKLMDMCKESFIEEHGAKKLGSAKFPYKKDDEGDGTVFNFKSKKLPKFFDAKGNPVKNPTALKIGGGSVLKLAGSAKAYNAGGALGVTFYLNQVQILKLVEYGGSAFGADDEGDFEASDDDTPASSFGNEEGGSPVSEEDIDF